MRTKHFEAIAFILNKSLQLVETKQEMNKTCETITRIANYFGKESEDFNRQKFISACMYKI